VGDEGLQYARVVDCRPEGADACEGAGAYDRGGALPPEGGQTKHALIHFTLIQFLGKDLEVCPQHGRGMSAFLALRITVGNMEKLFKKAYLQLFYFL